MSTRVRLKDTRDSKLTDQRSGSMLWVGGWGWCWLGEFRAIGSKRSDHGDKDVSNAAWGKADWLIGRRKSISAQGEVEYLASLQDQARQVACSTCEIQ